MFDFDSMGISSLLSTIDYISSVVYHKFKAYELLISTVQVTQYKPLHNSKTSNCHILYSHCRVERFHQKPYIFFPSTICWGICLHCYISHLELLPAYEGGFFLNSISQYFQISAQGYFTFSY